MIFVLTILALFVDHLVSGSYQQRDGYSKVLIIDYHRDDGITLIIIDYHRDNDFTLIIIDDVIVC